MGFLEFFLRRGLRLKLNGLEAATLLFHLTSSELAVIGEASKGLLHTDRPHLIFQFHLIFDLLVDFLAFRGSLLQFQLGFFKFDPLLSL